MHSGIFQEATRGTNNINNNSEVLINQFINQENAEANNQMCAQSGLW